MERSAMEGITDRLASIEGLYFPGATAARPPTPPRASPPFSTSSPASPHLPRSSLSLLLLFLLPKTLDFTPNHSPLSLLDSRTLRLRDHCRQTPGEFEVLKADYEVGWHLNHLWRGRSPTAEEARARSVMIRNRRRAYMELLIRGGEYSSEDAMREREPYLCYCFFIKKEI